MTQERKYSGLFWLKLRQMIPQFAFHLSFDSGTIEASIRWVRRTAEKIGFVMRVTLAAAVVMLISCGPVPALGQANPQPLQPPNPRQGVFKSTPQEQAACAPDAFKHCMSMGSDEVRVLGCLQQNRQQISAACRIVLESHGK